mgnify:CR=1 FL=1
MKFKCPSCEMQLKAEPDMAGKVVRCPGCNTKLQIPADLGASSSDSAPPPSDSASASEGLPPPPSGATEGQPMQETPPPMERSQAERGGWEEADPANPSMVMSLAIAVVCSLAWWGILFPFGAGEKGAAPVNTMDYIHDLFLERSWVNYVEAIFFFWAIAILYLKSKKLHHQRDAMYLDVLPVELGGEINNTNVGHFIDNLYSLPGTLRDSLMVNRIRKGLELFEVRQNNSEVSGMMSSQSDIDANRISSSYALVKVFLWAIPILGFIGTVLGLSSAIGGMDLSNVSDLDKIMGSIGNVTSGLGTAFDTTLLGLVLAMLLNFPMNALSKAEDDNLNSIDAFCNDVLLPRLNDGGGVAGGDMGGMMDTLVRAVASAQQQFLVDLNSLSAKIKEQAENLDKRADAHQERVDSEFSTMLNRMREDMTGAVKDSVKVTTDYTRALSDGIGSLNKVLADLGEKQVVIHQVKKKGWFSRG